jgi:hypothetical protein
MAEKKETNKKVAELINKLELSEPKEVVKAIKSLKIHGDETAIEPLIKLYSNTTNNAIQGEIVDLLNSIKFTAVPPILINCLTNPDYSSARLVMLSSIWNSNLDYTNYLSEIVESAQNGEMMDAMECLTILENMEGTLDEEKIMDALVGLKSYLAENAEVNTPKMGLLREVALLLTEINNSL